MSQSFEINWLVSVLTVALGAFVGAWPVQAARIWGSERFDSMAPAQRARLVRCFRAFGILLWSAGLLFAVDNIWFSSYHR